MLYLKQPKAGGSAKRDIGDIPGHKVYHNQNPLLSLLNISIVEIPGKCLMSLLSGMSDKSDKSDKRGYVMVNGAKYVNFVLDQIETANIVACHTISCDKCLSWEESGQNDLYRLTCGDGWLLRVMLDEITAKVEMPQQFIA